jgi:membrane associated rhomboid family serine protease
VIRPHTIAHADRRTTPLTLALIGINVAIFFAGELFPELGLRLFREGSQFRPLIDIGEWWRAATAMFLHSDFMHIIFNMWALWLFGPTIERRFGTMSFASLYLAAGLNGAALFHLVGRAGPAVGASGAIFGLFGALIAASYRQRHTPAGRAIFGQLTLLLALNLALPLFVPRIAWEAHLGGLIAGIVLAAAWDRMPRGQTGAAAQRAIVGFILAATAMLLIVFA